MAVTTARAKRGGAAGRKRGRGMRRGRIALAALLLAASVALWFGFGLRSAAQRAAEALAVDPKTAPVEVLAAPRQLRPGDTLDRAALERELTSLGYRKITTAVREPGEFRLRSGAIEVYRRRHDGPDGPVSAAYLAIRTSNGAIERLAGADGETLRSAQLEPVRLGAFRGERFEDRRPLPLDQFPARLVAAVLSSEDPRFLAHHGLDWRGLLRAARDNVLGGEKLQGGSTITQQVLKNRVVGTERTLARKLEEIALAPLVERQVGKERLLTIYLNEVYLGQHGAVSVVGFPAAALFYFGKTVTDLDLAEQALLAGLIASPGRFDPRRHPDSARQRRGWVLAQMERRAAITTTERQAAEREPLQLAPLAGKGDAAGDLLDAVRAELVDRGWEPQPGVRPAQVHTTIDAALQQAAGQALDATLDELERDVPRRAPLQGAVVVLSPQSGELLAMVGGRGGVRGGFHRALDGHRQPGSAFKPFVALAARGNRFGPATLLDDSPLTVPTAQGPWSPENFDHSFRGTVSLREALEQSLNVPLARVAVEIGPEAIVRTAHQAGIESDLPQTYSLALGSGEVTPLELARAYGTLASLGMRRPTTLLRSVVAESTDPAHPGAVDLNRLEHEDRAFDPADCYLVLDMLSGVVTSGTGRALAPSLGGVRVGGKTGSTQDGRDAWFVLVSSSAVVVVWVGRDDAAPAQLTGASCALPVVRRLLTRGGARLLRPLPEPPPEIATVEICASSKMRAGAKCPEQSTEIFREGEEPELCTEHLGFWRRLFQGSERTR